MKNRLTPALLMLTAAVLILDSRCAAQSVRDALELCLKTLIPGLFPLLAVSAMALPHLQAIRIPGLAGFLKIPKGSEGILILGTIGGFPVGAACLAQLVRSGALSREQAQRMLGLCSNCGPSFLFGVLATVLSKETAVMIFFLQILSTLLLGMLWPGHSGAELRSNSHPVSLTTAVRQAMNSMATVCSWVILAALLTGFLRRWMFPLLPAELHVLLTGLLEITGGTVALPTLPHSQQLFLGTAIICFSGVSVLLQIRAVASEAGIGMGTCLLQKTSQALLGTGLCWIFLRFGLLGILLLCGALLFGKIAVEIPRPLVYNTRRKEGI